MVLPQNRIFLDPLNVGATQNARQPDQRVTKFALEANRISGDCVLDINDLQPADIILFHGDAGLSSVIAQYQQVAGYTLEASRITHVAIYLDLDKICHARTELNPFKPGVEIESLFAVAERKPITVVRAPGLQKDLAVALRAAAKRGSEYDYSTILLNLLPSYVALRMFRGHAFVGVIADLCRRLGRSVGINPQQGDFATSYICSHMVYCCYNEIMRQANPLNPQGGIHTKAHLPADFYDNTRLHDVPLSLIRV